MGVAIIIPGVNFEDDNLGQVTPRTRIPVQSLSIVGNSVVYATEDFSVTYNPANTDEIGVYWSVESGGSFASINSAGQLSVVPGTTDEQVVIKATSTYNPSVYATKTLTVSNNAAYILREYLVNSVGAYVPTNYKPDPNFRLDFKYQIRQIAGSRNQVFGSRISASSQVFAFLCSMDGSTNKASFACGTNPGSANLYTNLLDEENTISISRTSATMNGETKSLSGTSFNATNAIDIFGSNLNGTHEPTNLIVRIYKISVYSSGTLIKTFTPAIRTADNVVGFYDEVNDEFFTNAGSGTLTISDN